MSDQDAGDGDAKRPERRRPDRGRAESRPRAGQGDRTGRPRVPGGRDRVPARTDRREGKLPMAGRRGDPDRRGARAGSPVGRRAPEFEERTPRHDDPPLPEDVEASELDRVARAELKTLSKDNADGVAKHLVMAGRLIEDDPELAHRHALAAVRRAGRVAVTRETLAITAYALGDFALALRELRTYRRLTGRNDQLPLMVDSERGVGKPDRALELGRSVPRADLEPSVQVALAIAMSGARLDLDQPDLALRELEIPQLDPDRAFSWSPELFDAYATVLEDLGRDADAARWYGIADRARAAMSEGDELIELEDEADGAPS